MEENKRDDRQSVYEIGYLVSISVPEEKVPAESDAVKKIITDAGSSIIAEELPHRQALAYTIRKKTVSGSYDKYDAAYFGWVKFDVGSDKIEAIKKAVEIHPSIIRMLLITTVRENTYLGKRLLAAFGQSAPRTAPVATAAGDKKDTAPVTIEEMDKSIDAMVKEA